MREDLLGANHNAKIEKPREYTKSNYMLYNIFRFFIGVTFANLGREEKESG